MKAIVILLLIVSRAVYGQYNEFTVYSNGLIYDETTMHRLAVIVDSLNLRFRTCDLSHPYYSIPQGKGTLVEVPSKAARKRITEGISLNDYEKLFPKNVKKKNVWVTKLKYRDYRGRKFIEYSGLPGNGDGPTLRLADKKANDKLSGWIIGDEESEALYLEKLEATELPLEYARMVQYVDCMIDTTAEIYSADAKYQVYQTVKDDSKAKQFIDWTERFPGKPKYPDSNRKDADSLYLIYTKAYQTWDSLRILYVDDKVQSSAYWRSLLMEARDEGLATGNSDVWLEFYVARYLSKEDALQLKRSRKVMGNCSMDQSPRYHAMSICALAAETAKWDIFLRSHLDIMNDRFERQSDGSYAWAGRKTYLKELEELDIPAVDLLIGTSLRVTNVSDNHYYSYIGRTGRALADAADKDNLENKILTMIRDERLDPYNRLLIAYLFDHYAYNLEDDSRKRACIQKLEESIGTTPEFVREIWKKGK